MANYKNIVDVEALAEASESTNVLVEENGSLKKVPAAAMGGGNGNFVCIDGDTTSETLVWSASVTYQELLEMYNNMELSGIIIRMFRNSVDSSQLFSFVDSMYYVSNYSMFEIVYFESGATSASSLYFLSDGTITETNPSSGGK